LRSDDVKRLLVEKQEAVVSGVKAFIEVKVNDRLVEQALDISCPGGKLVVVLREPVERGLLEPGYYEVVGESDGMKLDLKRSLVHETDCELGDRRVWIGHLTGLEPLLALSYPFVKGIQGELVFLGNFLSEDGLDVVHVWEQDLGALFEDELDQLQLESVST
jgi:hypothetical protein